MKQDQLPLSCYRYVLIKNSNQGQNHETRSISTKLLLKTEIKNYIRKKNVCEQAPHSLLPYHSVSISSASEFRCSLS